MKRTFILFAILIFSISAKSDVIYFPYQYALLSYSAEFIYSYELACKVKSSTVFWGGAGIVGSFLYLDEPRAGLELAVERRRYFKPDLHQDFFTSGYAGVSYMTDFAYKNDVGHHSGIRGCGILFPVSCGYNWDQGRNLYFEEENHLNTHPKCIVIPKLLYT